jgi:hypothetical protein
MSKQYSIPRLLWENVESVLRAQSKQFVREMAGYLRVSEKELIKQVLPSADTIQVAIIDSQQESNQCKAYVLRDHTATYCKKPVLLHSEYCSHHHQTRSRVIPRTEKEPIVVRRMKDDPAFEPLWITEEEKLIRADGTVVGKRIESARKIILFDVVDT